MFPPLLAKHSNPNRYHSVINKVALKALAIRMATVVGTGIAAVALNRIFQFSELLVRK
jgi:hypothetical protein